MIEIRDFVSAVFGAVFVLAGTFIVDIWWPAFLERRRPPRLRPEDVRPLTDRLSALSRDLDADGHADLARALEAMTLDALNLERRARGAEPLAAPKQLAPLREFPLVTADTTAQPRLWSAIS